MYERKVYMREYVERLFSLERKVNTLEKTLNDLIGNLIEYRTGLSMITERVKKLEGLRK